VATYLVTGGCGFIGSHLAQSLLAAGHGVRVLDDLSSGHLSNLAPGAEFRRGDAAEPADVAAAMEGCDGGVFHLAAIASVERAVRDWAGTHRVNLSGTINVFEAARRLGNLPVVYASSAATYGEREALPIAEDGPMRPLSAYGADKLGCEQHALAGGAVHGLPTFGLRFFNVFGPRQDPSSPYSGVISIFVDRLVRGEGVTVFGDGGQTRDFVFVADVVAALRAALPAASPTAPVANVCTGRATSVLELAHAVAAACGVERPDIRHEPARAGEIRHSRGARARLEGLLGLGEPVALREGLEAVVAWARAGKPGLAAPPAAA
jgi:UDP-glucose 4-epimerase